MTSGGKNVAPQSIEAALGRDRLVAEAVLIGEGRNFLTALIVPDFDELARRLGHASRRAPGIASACWSAQTCERSIKSSVDAVNACIARSSSEIKKFALLPHRFFGRIRGAHAHAQAQAPRHRGKVSRGD